jgi:hypothetical protein
MVSCTPLFSTVEAMTVRDACIIEFTLREDCPKEFILGAFASGWNVSDAPEDLATACRVRPGYG